SSRAEPWRNLPTRPQPLALPSTARFVCQSSAYRPAILSSKDDDSVGEHIIGSTGSPANFYGQGLEFGGTNSLSNLRFAWLSTALEVDQDGVLNLADAQFVNCRVPLYGHNQTIFNVENALCSSSQAMIESGPLTLNGWHLTLDQCSLVGSVLPAA